MKRSSRPVKQERRVTFNLYNPDKRQKRKNQWKEFIQSCGADVVRNLGYEKTDGMVNFQDTMYPDAIVRELKDCSTRDRAYDWVKTLLAVFGDAKNLHSVTARILRDAVARPSAFSDEKTFAVLQVLLSHLSDKDYSSSYLQGRCRDAFKQRWATKSLFNGIQYIGRYPDKFPGSEVFSLALRSGLFTDNQREQVADWTGGDWCLCRKQCGLCDRCIKTLNKCEELPRSTATLDTRTMTIDECCGPDLVNLGKDIPDSDDSVGDLSWYEDDPHWWDDPFGEDYWSDDYSMYLAFCQEGLADVWW